VERCKWLASPSEDIKSAEEGRGTGRSVFAASPDHGQDLQNILPKGSFQS
jgi:hypothetical protein